MPGLEEYQRLVHEARLPGCARPARERGPLLPQRRRDDGVDRAAEPGAVPGAHNDSADKAAFRDEVVYRVVAMSLQPDGSCFETFRRIDVEGRKA